MKNLITPYIQRHGVEELIRREKLVAKPSRRFPELVLLKYHMTESNMSSPKVQQCRGLIINRGTGEPVSWPYNKFFNLHEGRAHAIDWSTARVYEKLDGSLVTLYHYAGEWCVATSGDPDAGGPVNDSPGMTFATLFWRTFRDLGYQLPTRTDLVYVFELMTPENVVVVQHREPRLVLHGVRDMTTLEELRPEAIAGTLGWECVKTFDLSSESEVLAWSEALTGTECEGAVVVDASWNRVKIKAPSYVALHHLRSRWSDKNLVKQILAGEADELRAYFPDHIESINSLEAAISGLCSDIAALYDATKSIQNQKEFATAVKHHPASAALFQLRSGRTSSPREWCRNQRPEAILRILG